ncbi:F-box/kelch-repeat protein [Cardamine amara subsp. amara]|uniref:F-box/kelch-repeat protein n=1 Tax=Cardamine amara subsp. amara TaxID=228776 RepID=A0ABD1AZG9_CARAN
MMIGNPSTGQFLTLPKVKTRRKVLHVRQRRGSKIVSEEHQVFTLGAKEKWRMIEYLVGNQRFGFMGTVSTGELIFSSLTGHNPVKPFFFISYDLKENSAKKIVVEGIGKNYASVNLYLDHVESPMFLSNVS